MYGINICFLSEAFLRLKLYVENSVSRFLKVSLAIIISVFIYLF